MVLIGCGCRGCLVTLFFMGLGLIFGRFLAPPPLGPALGIFLGWLAARYVNGAQRSRRQRSQSSSGRARSFLRDLLEQLQGNRRQEALKAIVELACSVVVQLPEARQARGRQKIMDLIREMGRAAPPRETVQEWLEGSPLRKSELRDRCRKIQQAGSRRLVDRAVALLLGLVGPEDSSEPTEAQTFVDQVAQGLNLGAARYRRLKNSVWSRRGSRSGRGSPGSPEQPRSEDYRILGVEPGADWEEVQKAYRRKAREHHPDQTGGETEADQAKGEETMRRINEAYERLKEARG